MKTFSHLYQEVISIENLFQAWSEFKKGKRGKVDVGFFERHLEDNIFQLHTELANKTYRHAAYTGFYIRDPKTRHIHKAVVRDRIVHHALYKVLNPIFEPTFISDSFSCRESYGTHKGFKKLVSYTRQVSKNYTQDCWTLKCDVKRFFDSVDHHILLSIIRKKVKDPNLIWLLTEIIRSFEPRGQTLEAKRRGIPIGNLTSQLFANIYLNELDQFVKHGLKIKYYLRYADDFLILSDHKEDLLYYTSVLEQFLNERLRLELHPNKISFRKLSWGIGFVGYIALPHHQIVRTKTKKRIFRKIKERINSYNQEVIEHESFNQSIQSYLGILKHVDTYNLEQDLKNKIWFWLSD